VPRLDQKQISSLTRRSVLAGFGSAFLIRPALSRAADLEFTVAELAVDLDGHSGTFGRGINRKATVVGIATGELGPVAVRSRGKTAWTLPSTDLPSIANAINDAGVIAGALDNKAAIWEEDEPRMLVPISSDLTTAYGINRDGLVVGSADKGANRGEAVRWSGKKVGVLPSLGGPSSRALAVNTDGVIAGYSTSDEEGNRVRAVRWVDNEIEDLGTLGGRTSQAYAINGDGVIVGSATADDGLSGVDHAFRYEDGEMTRLPNLPRLRIRGREGRFKLDRSVAVAINNGGDICGFSASVSENDPASVATLWIGDEALNLNALIGKAGRELVLTSADGINGDRDLVCTGYLIGDEALPRLFRLELA
jgi:probable HAF family extracellular repeat protein